MKKIYHSSIPKTAIERAKTFHTNGLKCVCHYFKNRKKVGVRFFGNDGLIELEYGVRNRRPLGNHYEWISGKLVFFQTYKNGLYHGTAKQWSSVTGKLIGSFKINRGNGVDLWWNDYPGKVYLSEVRFLKNSIPHGFEWWLNPSEKSVFSERHWFNGKWHGIFRQWMNSRTLDRGFPKFFIMNKQVSKARYLAACETDPTLPKFKAADNLSYREFPRSLKPHLRRKN